MARFLFGCFALCVAVCCVGVAAFEITPKRLNGPPSEFAKHAVPSVLTAAVSSTTTSMFFTFAESEGDKAVNGTATADLSWTHELVVDSHRMLSFSVFSPLLDQLEVALTNPRGRNVPVTAEPTEFPVLGETVLPGASYVVNLPKTGHYTVTITVPDTRLADVAHLFKTPSLHGYLIEYTKSSEHEFSHPINQDHMVGHPLGAAALMYDGDVTPHLYGERPTALKEVVSEGILTITFPDGTTESLPMHDDGKGVDAEAGDHEWTAGTTAKQAGLHVMHVELHGAGKNGDFTRTVQHAVTVVQQPIALNGQATATELSSKRLQLTLGVTAQPTAAATAANYHAYAQVWATDAAGKEKAVAWTSGISPVTKTAAGELVLTLELDQRWIALADAASTTGLVLKDVQVQELEQYVPISTAAKMVVATTGLALNRTVPSLLKAGYAGEITKEMRQGVRPPRNISANAEGGLVMVHGYCSDTNPWQKESANFDNAFYYLNADKSFSHDEFSRDVLQFAEVEHGADAYAMIGFSQGGMVVTHTLNFYFSGSDYVTDGRLIQSLGSPYRGQSVAGDIANLGQIFGMGCGANEDMSVSGAGRWLATISDAAFEELYIYITQYETGFFGGGECNLLANLVLALPNDGVTEEKYAKVDGANFVSNKKGWCHNEGLKYPHSTTDTDRNVEMNKLAARTISA